MSTITRLYQFFDYKDVKKTNIEKKLGISHGYFIKMKQRDASIGSDILEKIFTFFPDLNPEWLILGKGNMIKNDVDINNTVNSQVQEPSPVYIPKKSDIVIYLEDYIEKMQEEIHDLIGQIAVLKHELRKTNDKT